MILKGFFRRTSLEDSSYMLREVSGGCPISPDYRKAVNTFEVEVLNGHNLHSQKWNFEMFCCISI